MAKANLDGIATTQIKPERCEFVTASLGEPLVLFLRPLTSTQWDAWRVRVNELRAKYCDGGWFDEAGKYMEKATVFILPGNPIPLPVTLNPETIGKIAKLELMQSAAPKDDRYDFDELVKMSIKCEDAWDAITVKAYTIQESYRPGKDWPVPSEKLTNFESETASAA